MSELLIHALNFLQLYETFDGALCVSVGPFLGKVVKMLSNFHKLQFYS